MRVLALDTSTRDGSIAVLEDDRVVVERVGDAARPQAERLPGDVLTCLQVAGATVADVDLFAIGTGPGSFTGLRIGIATVQGLALATGRRVAALSILDVLAHIAAETRTPGTTIGVWVDGYRHEVFNALYAVSSAPPFTGARVRTLESARVDRPDAVAARWQASPPAVVIGSGAVLYARLAEPLGSVVAPPPLAAAIGRLAIAAALREETVAPASLQPFYVRRPDVEIAREQRRHA